MDDERRVSYLRGMKDSTDDHSNKTPWKKTEEVMELAEQIYPFQSPTEFRKKAVI